jgi:hypothetical protein
VELALAGNFVEWGAEIYSRALYESVDEQAQRVHVYLCASWIWNGRRATFCTRLCWVEWTDGGRCSENGDLKGQKGRTGSRRGSEIGKKHRGEIPEGRLGVLHIRKLRWRQREPRRGLTTT